MPPIERRRHDCSAILRRNTLSAISMIPIGGLSLGIRVRTGISLVFLCTSPCPTVAGSLPRKPIPFAEKQRWASTLPVFHRVGIPPSGFALPESFPCIMGWAPLQRPQFTVCRRQTPPRFCRRFPSPDALRWWTHCRE